MSSPDFEQALFSRIKLLDYLHFKCIIEFCLLVI